MTHFLNNPLNINEIFKSWREFSEMVEQHYSTISWIVITKKSWNLLETQQPLSFELPGIWPRFQSLQISKKAFQKTIHFSFLSYYASGLVFCNFSYKCLENQCVWVCYYYRFKIWFSAGLLWGILYFNLIFVAFWRGANFPC